MTDAEIINIASRAFVDCQPLLLGPVVDRVGILSVAWHGTSVSPNEGAFALVKDGGEHTDLIGEIIKLQHRGRTLYAYVLGATDLEVEMSLARRAFLALDLLSSESINCVVEIVE